MGVVWASGFTVVPLAVGAIAQSTSNAVAYLAMVALSTPVLMLLRRFVRQEDQTAESRISAVSDSGGMP